MVKDSSLYFGQRIIHSNGLNVIDIMEIELQSGKKGKKK